MYIKNSITDHFNVFTLDTANIGNISTSKTQIVLPYSGPLPADLSNTTNAAISITIQVGLTVIVCTNICGNQAGFSRSLKR